MFKTWWQKVKDFMNSTSEPFHGGYDPENHSLQHLSDYEHPDMSKAPGGYDY